MDRRRLLVTWMAGLALTQLARAQFQQAPGSPYVTGLSGPSAIAVGDFNGDSLPDLAIADNAGNSVTVLLGTPTGAFLPVTGGTAISFNSPTSIVAGDFNGDGKLDLVVASLSSGDITLFTGTGTGTFNNPGLSVATGLLGPSAVAVADFNRDGYLDLSIAYKMAPAASSVAVYLGNGNGTFQSPVTGPGGNDPVSLAVGSFGGYPGVAVANETPGTVTVLGGNGGAGGTFTLTSLAALPVLSPNPTCASADPIFLAVADLNADGLPDIVIANQSTNNISVLLGSSSPASAMPNICSPSMGTPSNQSIGFLPAPDSPIAAGTAPVAVAIADFNRDGIPDLVVLNILTGNVMVLLGSGNGSFQSPVVTRLPAALSPSALGVADFNADGLPDFAVTDTGANSLTVFLNNYPRSSEMLSAASGAALAAPGSLVTIYGTNLATGATPATTPVLPASLGNSSVAIKYLSGAQDVLPLLYASASQINAMIPLDATSGLATYTVFAPTGTQEGTITLAPAAPALFSANQTGKGVAWAEYVSGSLQISDAFQCPSGGPGSCIPVTLSVGSGTSTLVFFGTGLRNASTANLKVIIGGQTLTPSYVGPSIYPGEDQVNVPLQTSLAGIGLVPVTLMVTLSNPATTLYSNSVTVYLE